MSKWIVFGLSWLLSLGSLSAQTTEERTTVTLDTTEGEIVLALYN